MQKGLNENPLVIKMLGKAAEQVVFTMGMRRQEVEVDGGASSTLSEDRDALWVAAEVLDIVMYPAESERLVLEAVVPRHHRVFR